MQRYLAALAGLALAAGLAQGQEYIDLEAERNQPAAAQGGAQPQGYGEMYYQLQLLQQEVMSLRGQLEQQGYELRQLKQQSLERYMDLDRRLSQGGGAAVETGSGNGGASPVSRPTAAEQPGEADAYRGAYSLVRSQQFDEAVGAFKTFLEQYPDGKYAANAHYWLGELYLVIAPQDLEASRQAFTLLLDQYPDNPKTPDALYKLGKVYFQKGNPDRARQYLERVVNEYGDSGSSAVGLARDFLAENL
jgi:tol-pal system protein YbgF